MDKTFLQGAFVYLSAAVLSVPIATRLGLGSVLGYLMAGVLIGPSVLNLVGQDSTQVGHFAELGVVVMLFLVGLELRPSSLWKMRKAILGLGGLQVVLSALALGLAAMAIVGTSWQTGLTIGLVLAMSSTAIVLQSLSERGQLKTRVGSMIFAVLLFQDIAVIPIFALLPLIAPAGVSGAAGADPTLLSSLPGWAAALVLIGSVCAIIVAGRWIMTPLFRFVAKSGLREIFVAFALLIVAGITLLMEGVGLSPALGTFLAGVVLSDSEYRHELEMDLEPFKGLLLAVFFITVGAGINLPLLWANLFPMLGMLAGFVGVKAVVLYGLARLFKMQRPQAANFSLALAGGGEFAFVLVSFAAGLGLLPDSLGSELITLIAMSMALSPLLLILDEKLIQPLFAHGETPRIPVIEDAGETEIIIAGYGRFGMTAGRLLAYDKRRLVVLDHDASQIEVLREFGSKVYYGDATRTDLLEAAGARSARLLIIALDNRESINLLVEVAQKHFPNLTILSRAIDRSHAYELLNAGVTHVFRETFGSSLDLGEAALVALGKHPYEAHRMAQTFHTYDDAAMRKAASFAKDHRQMVSFVHETRANIARVLETDRKVDAVRRAGGWEGAASPDDADEGTLRTPGK